MFAQNMLGYSPFYAGVSVFPRAISCFVVLLIMGKLADKIENRLLIVIGLAIMSASVFMFSRLNNLSSLVSIIFAKHNTWYRDCSYICSRQCIIFYLFKHKGII